MSENTTQTPYEAGKGFGEMLAKSFTSAIQEHRHNWQVTVGAGHTAVKWCPSCGKAYASFIAGNADTLQWHPVREAIEPESEQKEFVE